MEELLKIKDIAEGEEKAISLLIRGIEEKKTKTNKTYVTLTLSDGEQTIKANCWNIDKKSFSGSTNQVADMVLKAQMYEGTLSYTCANVKVNNELNVCDFLEKAPIPSEEMYDKLMNVICNVKSNALREVAKKLYEDNKDDLLSYTAAQSLHHAIYGGLLYHSYRMTQLAGSTATIYKLDKELIMVGALLHDIGKLRELSGFDMEGTTYTLEGELLGHLLIGCEMILSTYNQLKTENNAKEDNDESRIIFTEEDDKKILLLRHMIASHHGLLEYGSIKNPIIPEAMALHYIDMIDSKLYAFEDIYKTMESDSMSDKRLYMANNRFVYKA